MKMGPYQKARILLCSADAGPRSQRDQPCEAGFFLPGAKWVGATRNCAERLGCDFAILTTGHGMVRPWDVIEPYDMYIEEFGEEIKAIWEETIPRVLRDDPYDIIVFFAGGCPRKPMLEVLLPILREHEVSLITFGRPMMFDFDKMDDIVEALVRGTTCEEIKALLKKPERLEFHPGYRKVPGRNALTSGAKSASSSPKDVLFDPTGDPYHPMFVKGCVSCFDESYQATVREVIADSDAGINQDLFFRNVAKVMVSFKMTRQGPFKGVRFDGAVKDPSGQIERCWREVGNGVLDVRSMLDQKNGGSRGRALLEVPDESMKRIVAEVEKLFLALLPVCAARGTKGIVGASKVLFAVLPEAALPVDNTQWRTVFRTTDYGEVLRHMDTEITEWEQKTSEQLDTLDPAFPTTTLPAVYNVMAMQARKDLPDIRSAGSTSSTGVSGAGPPGLQGAVCLLPPAASRPAGSGSHHPGWRARWGAGRSQRHQPL